MGDRGAPPPQPPPRHVLSASIPGGGGSDPDLHARGVRELGVEKVKRMIANLTYVEMSVVKATTPTDGPPKRKHTRRLVDETWREPRTCPSECFHALSRCQVLNSPVVALKTLSVAHELMQRGSPAVLPAARDWREHFTMIKTHWAAGAENNAAPLAKVCAPLIAAYAEMLDAKARFHAERPAFENNYSFEQPDENEDARRRAAAAYPAPPVSAVSLTAMLSLGRACRSALDAASRVLPRDPPLAALEWHRLVAHAARLTATEAHLLHGAAVYVAATLANEPPLDGKWGLPSAEARLLASEHGALRMTFTEARDRPAIMSAFVEEGGDPALPPGWLGEGGGGGDRFRFLELPSELPSFETEEGRAAMASMIASSFGPPSSHSRPPPEPEGAAEGGRAVVSPFDEQDSDDENETGASMFTVAAFESPGGEPAGGALNDGTVQWDPFNLAKAANALGGVPRPVIDLPPLIDFTADETPLAAANDPGARRRNAQRRDATAGTARPKPAGMIPGTSASPSPPQAPAAMLSITGRPTARGPANLHGRKESRESILDLDASLAAFALTAARPPSEKRPDVDGAAPLMFADLAPEGVSSVRPPPKAPVSMRDARAQMGGGGAAGNHNHNHNHNHNGGGGGNQMHRAGGGAGHGPPMQHNQHMLAQQRYAQQQWQMDAMQMAAQQQQQQQQQQHLAMAQAQQQQQLAMAHPPPRPPAASPGPGATPEGWAKFDDADALPPPPPPPPAHPAPAPRAVAPPPPPAPAVVAPSKQEWDRAVLPPHAAAAAAAAPAPAPSGVGTFDEIPIDAIHFGKRVGTGAFGEVLKASYQGTDVAVKRLRLDPSQPQAAEDFRRELRVLCGLRHRHVVQFLGACTTGPDLCLVMDFCGFGSLYGVLHNRRQNITAAHVLRWMADTARGMVYLHSRNIIHRDVKSGNLLLDDSGVVKVADFGLARAHGPTSNLLTLVGTYPYMAPELLDSQPYNSSVDVYSFGVVMWECLTRDEPFRGKSPMQIVATLLRGERPRLPERPALPNAYVTLLTDCWATQPERRPTFELALERLLGIARAMRQAEGA